MRYWVYEDDRLAGPYTADELRERPRFEEGTLVIPEDRLEPGGGRWKRAADVPGLALVLSQKSRQAFANSLRPPEPAIRDLSILGSLLEQVERIEGVLVGMRAELQKYQAEAEKLWDDGKVREARATILDETNAKIVTRMEALEELQTGVAALRTELASAEQARGGLESRLTSALTRLAEASAALDASRGAQSALAAELVEVRTAGAGLRVELEATRSEAEAYRAMATARARADAEKAAAELALVDVREQQRWKMGTMRLTAPALAAGAAVAGFIGAVALALALRHEFLARKAVVPAVTKDPVKAEPAPPPFPKPKIPEPELPPAPEPVVPEPPPEPPKPALRARKPRVKPPVVDSAELRRKVLEAATKSGAKPSAAPATDEAEPQALALAFLAPNPAPGMCPRGLDELVAGDGGPVRTPQEALECWVWKRVGAAADVLAKARRQSRDEALADIQVDVMGWGGFSKVFPLEVRAEKVEGRLYTVVLERGDLLAEKLATRYKLKKKLTPARTSLSYEVDVTDRSIRPLDAASWQVLDSGAASGPLPAPAYKR